MDRPENGILIIPRIDKVDENGLLVVMARRLTFRNGNLISKDVLLPDGSWLTIPEGGEYPDECFLTSHFLDRISKSEKEGKWQHLKNGMPMNF